MGGGQLGDKLAEMQGKKITKKKKDPRRPKRAMPAFMYFSVAKRSTVKAANPGECRPPAPPARGGLTFRPPQSSRLGRCRSCSGPSGRG